MRLLEIEVSNLKVIISNNETRILELEGNKLEL